LPIALEELTVSRLKHSLYRDERGFVAFADDLSRSIGSESLQQQIFDTAFLMIKPEAVVTRQIEKIINLVVERGYYVNHAVIVRVSPDQVRALWRYQINTATPERAELMPQVLGATDSLLVGLKKNFDIELPAAVDLSISKGPADPSKRLGEHTRDRLKGIKSKLVTYIHFPEEPIDVIRELGVLVGVPQATDILLTSSPLEADRLNELIESLYERWPATDLQLNSARYGVISTISRAESGTSQNLVDELLVTDQPDPLLWSRVRNFWQEHEMPVDWNYLCVGATLVQMDRPGVEKQLASVDPNDWYQRLRESRSGVTPSAG